MQLTLSSEQSDLTVYRTQDHVYGVKLCSPNCTRAIKPGSYSFGIRSRTDKPVWNKRVFPIDRDQTLFVEYESHRRSRRAGAILLPATIVTTLFVALVARFMAGLLHDPTEPGAIAGYGIVAVGCAALLGGNIWLLVRPDRAVVRTPAEHARAELKRGHSGFIRLPPATTLSRQAMACAAPEDTRLELSVEIDEDHRVKSLRAPSSFGRGGRRCLYSALRGQKLPEARAGQVTLVLER